MYKIGEIVEKLYCLMDNFLDPCKILSGNVIIATGMRSHTQYGLSYLHFRSHDYHMTILQTIILYYCVHNYYYQSRRKTVVVIFLLKYKTTEEHKSLYLQAKMMNQSGKLKYCFQFSDKNKILIFEITSET